jgi:hypothetical protein
MQNSGLDGPFVLTNTKIDSVVTEISPGTYALGRVKDDGTFVISYIGRSDSDLNSRLHNWDGHYSHFKASYFLTAKAAFEKECMLYHMFGENRSLDNEIHPACPANSYWKCPISGCQYC